MTEGTEVAWLTKRERGSGWGIRILLAWTHLGGRALTRPVLAMVAAYYGLFDADVRQGSVDYLRRLYPRVSWRMIHRHINTFAQCTLDRFFLLGRRFEDFEVTCTGIEHLRELHQARRGAILLGAHLGSFDAARAVGDEQDFVINALVHSANARRINRFLSVVNPELQRRIIEIDPRDSGYIFRVQEAIERGEFVAILGDRVGLNERSTRVDFLGTRARFSTGPYALAAALGCPIYLTFGLYHPPNRYDLHCEPFVERVALPKEGRDAALEDHAQRFARRLEHYCRMAPYNWFNFFDFWS